MVQARNYVFVVAAFCIAAFYLTNIFTSLSDNAIVNASFIFNQSDSSNKVSVPLLLSLISAPLILFGYIIVKNIQKIKLNQSSENWTNFKF